MHKRGKQSEHPQWDKERQSEREKWQVLRLDASSLSPMCSKASTFIYPVYPREPRTTSVPVFHPSPFNTCRIGDDPALLTLSFNLDHPDGDTRCLHFHITIYSSGLIVYTTPPSGEWNFSMANRLSILFQTTPRNLLRNPITVVKKQMEKLFIQFKKKMIL